MTLEADFKEFGWTKVENVECLWRLETAKSDALLGTIVDDLLFTESTGYASTDATIDFLRKKYSGVKAEHEPSSFAGYKIETSADLSVCTLSMPITTSKCAELTVFIREAARGMGILDNKPTVIRSDNASSVRVANDPKAAGRLRHAMRRYSVLQEHVKQGVVRVEFIRDANNAADFLTKWVPAAKLKASIAYNSNEAVKPKKQAKTEISTLEVSMIEEEGTFMTMRSGKRKYPPPPPPIGVPQPMPFLDDGQHELFVWQESVAGEQLPRADDEAPVEPIAASPAPEAPDPEPEQPDWPEHPAAPMPPAQTTLADPKHFAHRLFDSGLPGPSGSHGAYYKGRTRSYEPYDDDELNAEFYGHSSDAQNSD